MRPSIIVTDLPVKVSPDLLNLLWLHMAGKQTTIQQAHAVTLNFRDPSYSATTGGFHPVEIRLTRCGDDWHLAYVTDFAYVGIGDYAELAKELDFDFSSDHFSHALIGEMPSADVSEWFSLWQDNFLSYHSLGVYTVQLSLN